jgi:hypothetical protein
MPEVAEPLARQPSGGEEFLKAVGDVGRVERGADGRDEDESPILSPVTRQLALKRLAISLHYERGDGRGRQCDRPTRLLRLALVSCRRAASHIAP